MLTLDKPRRRLDGKLYQEVEYGVLVPVSLVREAGTKLRTPRDIVPLLQGIAHAEQENFLVVTLNGGNKVIKVHHVTIGLVNQSQIHPREVFRPAIQDNAVSLIMAHNHPSGNLEPSETDLVATRRMVECSKTLGIHILDHIIVSPTGFLSLKEQYPGYF